MGGRYDPSSIVPGAQCYKHNVPDAELHILDAGHFALDEKTEEIARLTRAFMGSIHRTDPRYDIRQQQTSAYLRIGDLPARTCVTAIVHTQAATFWAKIPARRKAGEILWSSVRRARPR